RAVSRAERAVRPVRVVEMQASELHARARGEWRGGRGRRVADVADAAEHPHAARHHAALEPQDEERAPSPGRGPLTLQGREQAQRALRIDIVEREPRARPAW